MSNLLRNYSGRLASSTSDDLSGPPPDSFWAKWFGGIVFPFLIAAYSTRCIITRTGTMIGQNTSMPVTGNAALALGVSLAGAAFFMHSHYFWGNTRLPTGVCELGKIAGLCIFIGGMFSLFWVIMK